MRAAILAVTVLAAASSAAAQVQKPRLDLTPSVTPAVAAPGSTVLASLRIKLPAGVHVQSDKPHDSSLIATALTIEAPAGVTVDRIGYPAPTELAQPGRARPLAVFGPELSIEVRLSIASTLAPGEVRIPGQLRYQACDERVCFPPSKVPMEWRITVDE